MNIDAKMGQIAADQGPEIHSTLAAAAAIMNLTKGSLDVVSESDRPARSRAILGLARRLHWKMEHLDPTNDPEWDRLSDCQREFYCLCVEALFDEKTLIDEYINELSGVR
jgi:hypothetical protein